MGVCSSDQSQPNAAADTAASPTKAPGVLESAKNGATGVVANANTAVSQVSGHVTQATQATDQAKATVTNASTLAANAGTQANAAAAQASQLASQHAPAPVAGLVNQVATGAQGATSTVTGGVNSVATSANSATNVVGSTVGSASQTVQTHATTAQNILTTAEAKGREAAGQGAGGLKQVSDVANQAAAGAPAPVASLVQPLASKVAEVSSSGSSSLQAIGTTPVTVLAPHSSSDNAVNPVAGESVATGSQSSSSLPASGGANAPTSSSTSGSPLTASNSLAVPPAANNAATTLNSANIPSLNNTTAVGAATASANKASALVGSAENASGRELSPLAPSFSSNVASSTSAQLGGLSTFKTFPEPTDSAKPLAVHVVEGASSDHLQAVRTASPSARSPSPITVNPTDSAAKQRVDLAALNVRKLKKERAPLEAVKAAVEEFKAAKAAHGAETGNLAVEGTSEAVQTAREPRPDLESAKVESLPSEAGVMHLPVLLEPAPVSPVSSGGKSLAKIDQVNAAADQVRAAKQSGKPGGKNRGKGGNQSSS